MRLIGSCDESEVQVHFEQTRLTNVLRSFPWFSAMISQLLPFTFSPCYTLSTIRSSVSVWTLRLTPARQLAFPTTLSFPRKTFSPTLFYALLMKVFSPNY
jgi:hypothetical protein